MTFDRLHRGVTLVLVALGAASLFLSGEFSVAVVVPALVAPLAGAWLWRPFERRRLAQGAGVLAVVVGGASLWAALGSEDYLYWAIVYAVFLATLKSWMLRRSADFLQMYALSFLEVMAAAVVNPGLSFGLLVLPYTILLVLALMLANLRRGIEAQATGLPGAAGAPEAIRLRAALARRDLVRPAFLTVTVAVTTAVVLVSFVFFLFFPRLGFGFFARQSRRGLAVSGFSETVRLGDFGNIAEDPEVVLRVRMRTGGRSIPMRMRGQSLDQYDGTTWRKTTQRRRPMTQDGDARFRLDLNSPRLDVPDVQVQEIYLEPMLGTPRVLFGMPAPVAFERPPDALEALRPQHWRFFRDDAGDVSLTGPQDVSIVYTAYSDPRPRDPVRLRDAGTDYPDDVRRLYLALPPQKPEVAALARQVAAGRTNPYEVAGAVQDWLRSAFEYTLESTHGEEDPLADFLLVNRRGHCEYFASGMVVMLRTLGIPARIVNGFYGGTRNEYGDYVALRRADAHSWVEVYFPGQGWATFDPTPASALDLRSGRSWWNDVRDAVDAVKLAWYRWVVEYNLEKQVQFLASLLKLARRGEGGAFGDQGLSFGDAREMGRQLKAWPWRAIGLSIAASLLGAGLAAWAWRRRRRQGKGRGVDPDLPEVRAYRRMRRVLARHGFIRGRSETQLELATRVAADRPGAAATVHALTWAYLRAVCGAPGPAATPPVEPNFRALDRALADPARSRGPA